MGGNQSRHSEDLVDHDDDGRLVRAFGVHDPGLDRRACRPARARRSTGNFVAHRHIHPLPMSRRVFPARRGLRLIHRLALGLASGGRLRGLLCGGRGRRGRQWLCRLLERRPGKSRTAATMTNAMIDRLFMVHCCPRGRDEDQSAQWHCSLSGRSAHPPRATHADGGNGCPNEHHDFDRNLAHRPTVPHAVRVALVINRAVASGAANQGSICGLTDRSLYIGTAADQSRGKSAGKKSTTRHAAIERMRTGFPTRPCAAAASFSRNQVPLAAPNPT